MTKLQKIEFFELLKEFNKNEKFSRLVELLPMLRIHRRILNKVEKCNYDYYDANEFEILVRELEDLERIEKGGN